MTLFKLWGEGGEEKGVLFYDVVNCFDFLLSMVDD
jgi:hypothetical protein